MPDYKWGRPNIIDEMADPEFFRELLLDEIHQIADETGRRFVSDQNFEDSLARCANRYRHCLDLRDAQDIAPHEGAIAAAQAMFRILHEEYLDPTFEVVPGKAIAEPFGARLISISSRGLVAHNFCYRFLVLIAWHYLEVPPVDDENFDALVEEAVRNFEGNVTWSFEAMKARAFKHQWPKR